MRLRRTRLRLSYLGWLRLSQVWVWRTHLLEGRFSRDSIRAIVTQWCGHSLSSREREIPNGDARGVSTAGVGRIDRLYSFYTEGRASRTHRFPWVCLGSTPSPHTLKSRQQDKDWKRRRSTTNPTTILLQSVRDLARHASIDPITAPHKTNGVQLTGNELREGYTTPRLYLLLYRSQSYRSPLS